MARYYTWLLTYLISCIFILELVFGVLRVPEVHFDVLLLFREPCTGFYHGEAGLMIRECLRDGSLFLCPVFASGQGCPPTPQVHRRGFK